MRETKTFFLSFFDIWEKEERKTKKLAKNVNILQIYRNIEIKKMNTLRLDKNNNAVDNYILLHIFKNTQTHRKHIFIYIYRYLHIYTIYQLILVLFNYCNV